MRNPLRGAIFSSAAARRDNRALAGCDTAAGQAPAYVGAAYTGRQTPNLNGIWQTLNTANWDIQGQRHGRDRCRTRRGGRSSRGLGWWKGDEIPYLPRRRRKGRRTLKTVLKADPEIQVLSAGCAAGHVYAYPFQIVQTPKYIPDGL